MSQIRRLLIEDTPLEWRALLTVDDVPTRLAYLHHTRPISVLGMLTTAKVTAIDKRLNAAFLKLRNGEPGFLRRRGPMPAIGETILVEIKREPIGEKGAEVSDAPTLRWPCATWPLKAATLHEGPLGDPEDVPFPFEDLEEAKARLRDGDERLAAPLPYILAALGADDLDEILVTTPELKNDVQRYVPQGTPLFMDDRFKAAAEIDAAEELALSQEIALADGGRLVVDEAEALTAIDLDLGRAPGQSAKGAADRLLGAALTALGGYAQLANLGGQIVVDVPRAAIASPKIIRDRLMRTFKPLGRVSVPAVTPEGVCVVIAPKTGPSVLGRLTVSAGGGVRPGRDFAADVVAAKAWRALDRALDQDRTGNPTLELRADAMAHFTPDGDVAASLRARYGPRFTVRAFEEVSHGRPIPFRVSA